MRNLWFLYRISKCQKIWLNLIILIDLISSKAISKLFVDIKGANYIRDIGVLLGYTILTHRTDKLYLRNWVTYIVFRVECKRYSLGEYRSVYFKWCALASFFNPFARGSLFGSQVAPPFSPTEGRSVEHLSNFRNRSAGYRWLGKDVQRERRFIRYLR